MERTASVSAASTALLSQAWHSATYGGELLTPAFRITDRWRHLSSGRTFYLAGDFADGRAEAEYCAAITVRICQLRLLDEKDLRAEAAQQLAIDALTCDRTESWLRCRAGSLLLALPGELYRTFLAGR